MFKTNSNLIFGVLLTTLLSATVLHAADETELPKIADGPKVIDSGRFMPEVLRTKVTVEFLEDSLVVLADWFQDELGVSVLLDEAVMDLRIHDHLDDAPAYLLLERLEESVNVGWYMENDVLHITMILAADEHLATRHYNIADFVALGYPPDDLIEVIEVVVAPTTWNSVGGAGTISLLGDVLVVTQGDSVLSQVDALLVGLPEHGRQTFIFEPISHQALREALKQDVAFDRIDDMPLTKAVALLSDRTGLDIRLDIHAFDSWGLDEEQPVFVRPMNCSLEAYLQAMLSNLDLTLVLRDGALWITTDGEAEDVLRVAIYDVRDICRSPAEAEVMYDAIGLQIDPMSWGDLGGPASMRFPKPATLAVRAVEATHSKLLALLDDYRAARQSSWPNDHAAVSPEEVTTVYYRLNAAVAEDLFKLLPTLVQQDSWKSTERPDAPGTILLAASPPVLLEARQATTKDDDKSSVPAPPRIGPQAVLIVTQTRLAHEEIESIIRRVESGDHTAERPVICPYCGPTGGYFE